MKTRVLAALLSALALGGVCAPAEAWWNTAWTCRRVVTVPDFKPSKLPGDEIAVVAFPTGGLCKPDGSDIRVANAEDQEVPCRLLMTGPGDVAHVAFAPKSGGKYFVYYGNPKAEAIPKEKEPDIRRGVLLEMWEYPGGPFRNLAQAQDIIKKVRTLLGRDFRDRIWSGHNPFGPQTAIACVYTGWLNITAEGEYSFALSSQNASFLLVDDKLLIENGGNHGPQYDVAKNAKVHLSPGLTKVTFYHVSNGGDPIAALVWCPSMERDKKSYSFVPAAAFASILRATPGLMEQYGQSAGVDFLWEHAGETFVANRYYQRYTFSAMAVGNAPRNMQWKWDFGDGQTSTDPQPQHVYLLPGECKVQLSASFGGAPLTRANRIVVARPWDRVTQNKLDSIREHAAIVQRYDFKSLPPGQAAEAVILFQRVGASEGVMQAGAALMAASQPASHALSEALPYYVKALVAAGQGAEAVTALTKASERQGITQAVSATLLVHAGQVALEGQEDPKRAGELFEQVLAKNQAMVGAAVLRQAKIGMGDVYRWLGDGNRARQAYAEARTRPVDRPGGEPLIKGDYARHVEEYLRTRDYESAEDYLDEWGEAFPLDRLEGYWSLLRARYFFERGQTPAGVREAQLLVRSNPASNYAAEALMAAADNYINRKQPEKAADLLRQIVKDYPESPHAAEAAKLLKK